MSIFFNQTHEPQSKPSRPTRIEDSGRSSPMSFAPFLAYLQQIKPKITTNSYSEVQQQVLQGFYYGLCAVLLNDDVLGDVDHILGYAGESYVKHYRSDCVVFHGDFAHLAATCTDLEGLAEEAIGTAAAQFQAFFERVVPAPYADVFHRLADGEAVVVESVANSASTGIQTPTPIPTVRTPARLTGLHKSRRRHQRRAKSPPASK